MRTSTWLLLLGTLAIADLSPDRLAAAERLNARSVFALRIVRDAGEGRGTCILIHREDRGNAVVLYFLTSSRLFKAPDGDRWPPERAIHLLLDEERTLAVKQEDVFVADGSYLDITVFRVLTSNTTLQPTPVVYDPPRAGSVFLVSGFDETGAPVTVEEHIRFESTRQVFASRDASGLLGCVGAPAISADGVFGVVRECEVKCCPIISLLSVARRFIERHVPRPGTLAPTQADIVDRQAVARPAVPASLASQMRILRGHGHIRLIASDVDVAQIVNEWQETRR